MKIFLILTPYLGYNIKNIVSVTEHLRLHLLFLQKFTLYWVNILEVYIHIPLIYALLPINNNCY